MPLEAIRDRFLELCESYARELDAPPAGIVLCSEMHGFGLIDDAGRPRSPYVSWKDERARELIGGVDTVTLVTRALGDRFRAITGMRPRPGLPLMNLVHLLREEPALPDGLHVVSLPDWLARACGDAPGWALTMRAGTALHDLTVIARRRAPPSCGADGPPGRLGAPAEAAAIAGAWRHRGRRVPIHAGWRSPDGAGIAGDCLR